VPIFRPRNRVEILRDMAARVVARSRLKGLFRNSVTFHILAAAANELSEAYVQLARMRALFSIDKATGTDLDERAAEIVGNVITRRSALHASGTVVFTRPGTAGTVTVPSGTIVAAQDAQGLVKFRTTSAASITPGNTSSAAVAVIALDAGIRGNVEAGTIVRFVTRVTGVTGVSNTAAIRNGLDRERDQDFRARLKDFVQSLSRGTPRALEGFARNVLLSDGRRVVFAHVVEPAIPNGIVELFIDDGTGAIESYDSSYLTSPDTIVSSASGGETDLYTTQRPIRDDGSFEVRKNGVTLVRGTDYELNPALGQIELAAPLVAADAVEADYRYYTGLIQQTQRVIDGDEALPLAFPGVRASGVMVLVKAPQAVFQTLVGQISVASDYDVTEVIAAAKAAVQEYVNGLDIGEHVIAAEIVQRVMEVDGVTNFRITSLSGSVPPVADQVILPNQVARVISASITIT
jgi:uncharacterized phage protein gp47/JayE